MNIEELAKQGKEEIKRTMAYSIALKATEVRKESIKNSLIGFKSEEHRMEKVSTIQGIDFIDDAFSTTINSTWFALQEINKPIIWIAGGIDMGNDYTKLMDVVKEKVKALICLGTNNENMVNNFSEVLDHVYETDSMRRALEWSLRLGNEGEVVLLSPTCASFDLFSDYREKGDLFKKVVKTL